MRRLKIGAHATGRRTSLNFSFLTQLHQLEFESSMTLKKSILRAALMAAFTATTLGFGAVGTVYAAAPMVKTSAPGYYRMMLGDFEVTALSDGTVNLPVDKLLTNTTPAKVNKALAKSFQSAPLETSVNGYLINTGSKLVLIDTGAAKLFGPTLGNLLANLKAAGYQPEQVDEIYITHMHPDHVGGLMDGDKLAFPNATLRADKHDADFWLSQANLDKAPDDAKGFFQGAMASLNPYVKANRFSAFDGNTDLVPGIKAMASRGHTAGHSTYVVESRGQKLVIWGDLIHVAAVQFDDPSVTIAFDSESKAAAVQRKAAYADAARGGYVVAAAHIAFPGLGRVRVNGKAFTWVPVNYSVVR
jgi:glyoxylase-like metal-dependent hydrolase (beta-lactamase superfamily II)